MYFHTEQLVLDKQKHQIHLLACHAYPSNIYRHKSISCHSYPSTPMDPISQSWGVFCMPNSYTEAHVEYPQLGLMLE